MSRQERLRRYAQALRNAKDYDQLGDLVYGVPLEDLVETRLKLKVDELVQRTAGLFTPRDFAYDLDEERPDSDAGQAFRLLLAEMVELESEGGS